MKTLADEIIEGIHNDKKFSESPLINTQLSNRPLRKNNLKPKSAGNKSFRIHNSLRFIKTIERSKIGRENKL